MEIITVHTTQNIDIEYEIGGLGERILAYLIDMGIFIALAIIINIIIASAGSTTIQVFLWIIYVLFIFYDLICEVFFNGQSIGKLIMKIRVISLDGARPKFSQYLLRWLFRMVDFAITLWLGGLISAAMTKNGQRIGDLVAGTVIIKTKPRTKMNNLVFASVDDSYKPVFTQVSQLSDQDIELIHEVIQIYYKTGNSSLVYTMADKIRDHLLIALPPNMNSMQFLQTVIKDYSHIATHADAL
jgi:uncharacterized RDD family membrane protein YckC